MISLVTGYVYYGHDLPDVEEYMDAKSEKIVQINYSNGNQITRYEDKNKKNLQFYRIPSHLVNAVLAIEDQKFFNHYGFDIKGIKRAFEVNRKSGKIIQGGSTITQQLAKMLFLSPEKSMKRKIKELILAFKLEHSLTKEQILTLYLNNAYFGSGKYGVADAAQHYFSKDISEITLEESTRLAALLKAPSVLSKKNNKKIADQRAKLVLDRMLNSGFIDNNYEDSLTSKVNYKKERLQKLHFTDYVYNNYQKLLGGKKLKSGKIIINSTLNERLQKIIEDQYALVSKKYSKIKDCNFTAVIADKDGSVEALVSGPNYIKQDKVNHLGKKNGVSGLLDIFILASAFESGFTPYDLVKNEKNDKLTTILEAYKDNNDSICQQIKSEITNKDIKNLFTSAGDLNMTSNKIDKIISKNYNQSIFEIVRLYSAILNNSHNNKLSFVNKIEDGGYNALYYKKSNNSKKKISNRTLSYVKSLMQARSKSLIKNQSIKTLVSDSVDDENYWLVGSDGSKVIAINISNHEDKEYVKKAGVHIFKKIVNAIN